MLNRDGIRWHCPDRNCNWTMVAAADENLREPQCICGRTMQRVDAVPAFHYLDFLRDDTVDGEETGEKE